MRLCAFPIVVLLCTFSMAAAQTVDSSHSGETLPPNDEIARIVGYAMTSGGAAAFLETLTDTIGGRITGSAQSRATAELILKTLKEAGLDNAHFEEYELTSTWQHGPAVGEVIHPVRHALLIGSYGWVPGTPGPIEVPVADFGAPGDNHVPHPGQVRGAAVTATRKLLKPLAALDADRVYLDADFDSDHESFMVVGVPAYSLRVDPGDYDARHHTIIDTFERIDLRMLGIHTAVLAVAAYSFANAEQAPGRRLSPTEVRELLKKTGLQPLYELEYPNAQPE